ncbi:cfia complex component [Lasallia pustulata]|nr:cfia complex component [Lasallia pustulata]
MNVSRSASRTSVQSTNQAISKIHQTNGGSVRVVAEAGELATKPSANGVVQVDGDNMGSVQHSVSHTPISQLSTDVSIPNAAQDKGASGLLQNGGADTVPNSATVLPETGAAAQENNNNQPSQTLPASQVDVPQASTTEAIATPISAAPRARLPHDRIGILEDRIRDDPRGDMDAWLSLINEHKRRSKLDDARQVYERFFTVFPSAAEQWIAYAKMENDAQNRLLMEHIFNKTLLHIPNVHLWALYLGHVLRHNNLTTDTSGAARQIISQAYDLALQHIGIDKDSGNIWQDYVHFIRSGPGMIGGSNWQDQQKMDLLRKTYQRAICIPTQAVHMLWKEYDGFEMGLNKMTGRKFLQDQSPAYMSARSSYTELQNITRELRRTTLPVLPPALGFDGDVEYMKQLDIWKRWIQWEKDDPLVLKQDDVAAYRDRVVFVYKQALMAMRFWPEMWFDAAEFCYQNNLETEGNEFLTQGITANPESCLLAFKRADRLELTTSNEEGDESAIRRGAAVREPYERVLDALYDLIAKVKTREAQDLARIAAQTANNSDSQPEESRMDDEEGDNNEDEINSMEKRKKAQIEAVKNVNAVQIRLLSKTVSYAWIALMRALRRIQGKGKVNSPIGGSRQVFTDARRRGRITSDVYVANALIEFHCYDPEATKKIFERGLKLFPEDESFALEYIKHLIAINDLTNARVVFETAVNKLAQKPETVARAKPIYAFFHDFESRYGELSQITKLEKRMRDLFPEDPMLTLFSRRFLQQGFDPTAIRPIISPATQARPRAIPSIETPPSAQNTPPSRFAPPTNSPKRPMPFEEPDPEATRPRKLARGESPLKGAAGRRLDQQKRNRQPNDLSQYDGLAQSQLPPPPLLPRDVLFLLSIIPKAETYHATRFKPEEMVRLIRETGIPSTAAQLRPPPGGVGVPPIHQMSQMSQIPQIPQGHYNGQHFFNR